MSFLFKSSKKGANPNALPPASRDLRSSEGATSQIPTLNGINGMKPSSPTPGQSVNPSLISLSNEKVPMRDPSVDKSAHMRDDGTPRGSGPPSPEQKSLRDRSQDAGPQRLLPQARAPTDPSPYPWSQRRLNFTVSHTNPFPRYGAAVNATASKDGSIYLMGGLINGSTVKGDLWMVEAGPGNMICYPVATTSEGPGPRVGHASLLVGNAFIVFGGDTKMDEGDMLDDTLYLLNTSTKQWSRALPAGPRPPGRYGHTLTILGSKIYVFGGQVEGYFFNDLVAFDLNALQQASNRWEILIQNTIDGGPPHGQIPPARTNHTMISWGERLYLFGGTDGVHWFNDAWSYSPHTNSWTQLECIGYIPSAREGHAAALVGDVMYIFGGRTEEGNDLGDLAAFRITSRRWYTFQNMGPSPSPRSGHSMTTIGKSIAVLAGEPSSAPRDPVELGMAYFLDTSKIKYPQDSANQTPVNERIQGHKRPSGEKSGTPVGQGRPMAPRELMERERVDSTDSPNDMKRSPSESQSRLPRPGQQDQLPAPSGPPPQQLPPQPNGMPPPSRPPSRPDRALSPSLEAQRFENRALASPQVASARESPAFRNSRMPTSAAFDAPTPYLDSLEHPSMHKPETYKPSQEQSVAGMIRRLSTPQRTRGEPNVGIESQQRNRTDMDHLEETPRESMEQPEHMPKVRELQHEDEGPQDSGIGSSPALTQQYDGIIKELEQVKQKNAWYASELALARKSGYQTKASDSPVLDLRATEVFADDDRPLIEALLKMHSELARVQTTIDEQSKNAAQRIAEMQKQRDAAIHEAVSARARSAGQSEGSKGASDDASKRLASSLAAQSELSRRNDGLIQEVEIEKKSRQLAEETADAAQRRVTELDMYRQQHASEVESLRYELHEAQKEAREVSANHSEILTQHKMLSVDRNELHGKLESALAETQNHASILSTMREAVTASTDKTQLLELKLDEERSGREGLEQKLRQLKSEHEERTNELESASRRLRDAEELAEKHAEEARTHRTAVLAGLGKINDRGVETSEAAEQRVAILQQQVEAANAMVRRNQEAADTASEKLRRAEERIAGLEAYQEQASREGLSVRKQLQGHMKDIQALALEKAGLEQKLESQLLETNALAVQHSALKDILGERGINAVDVRKSRALDSPNSISNRFSTPDFHRVRELEQQLEASLRSHEEMRQQFDEATDGDEKMKHEYEEKLTALDNDYQAAVKYLRGTEKMLSKMKQELQRVKNENGDLRRKLEKAADSSKRATPEVPADWEAEKERLNREVEESQANLKNSVAELEGKITTMQGQLQSAESELQQTRSLHATSQADITTLQATHSQSRSDLEKLQKENTLLEERARDAENKVQLLLDQVEHSVDNYRRQSRRLSEQATPTMNGTLRQRGSSSASAATGSTANNINHHTRDLSGGAESTHSSGEPTSAGGEGNDGRNSLALDSLASELDALRTHWETTNKNYRLSDKFDFERTPTSAAAGHTSAFGGSLASWRQGLDIDDEDENSRPGTSDGPVKNAGSTKRSSEAQLQGTIKLGGVT